MLFFRLWFGCMVQMLPFAFLCFFPFQKHYRFSVKAVVRFTGALVAGLGILFAAVCMYLKSVFPVSQLLFDCANLTFVLCLIPCFLWYFYAVDEIWQKKVFIFMFSTTSALAMTSVCNVIETHLYMDAGDGLPYYGTAILTLVLLTAVTLPLLLLLLKHFYLPVSDGLQKKRVFRFVYCLCFYLWCLAAG